MAKSRPSLYGIMAEFESAEELVAAARQAYEHGYRRMDAYTPFPVEGLPAALGFHRTGVPLLALIGGMIGCVGGFLMQYYLSAVYFPMNIGGRPLNSWPAFIPVTFELTVLVAALAAVLGMLALNRLPMPYHPVFNVPRFALATKDRFFLCIEVSDRQFDVDTTRRLLDSMAPRQVSEVEN